MKKSLAKISYVGLGNMVNAALGFVYLSIVARALAVDQFGRYALLVSLLIFLSKIMDFGTNSTYVAKSITTQDKSLTSHFVSVKVVLFLVSTIASLILLVLFKLSSLDILFTFLLGLFFYGLNYTLFGLFQRIERYTILIFLNSIPALIKGLFAVLIFLGYVEFSFVNFFMVFALSIGPSALLYFFLPDDLKKIKLDFSKMGATIKEAVSPGISQLINEGFPAVSNSLARIYSNFTSVGIFSLADKISSAFVLVSFTIFTVLLPKNATRKKEKKGYDYKETLFLAVGVLFLSIFTIIFAKFFVPWFFQDKYNESLGLLNVMVVAGALSAVHTFMENYFFVEDKTHFLAYISGGKLALLLLLSVILIPALSLRGLALAHLIAAATTLFVMVYLMSKTKATQYPQTQISD
ncbi:lipopolysaccharide biosynthesis protein [Patescibacteria group bacterium]